MVLVAVVVVLLLAVAILPELSRASRKRLNSPLSLRVPPVVVWLGVAGRGSASGVSNAERGGRLLVGGNAVEGNAVEGDVIEGNLLDDVFVLREVLVLG